MTNKYEWESWVTFFERNIVKKYPTLDETKNATIILTPESSKHHIKDNRQDPRLPYKLSQSYPGEWKNWATFFE